MNRAFLTRCSCALLLAAGLTACGDGESSLPGAPAASRSAAGTTPSGSATPSTTATPSASAGTPVADSIEVVPGSFPEPDSALALSDTWYTYWKVRMQAFHDVSVQATALNAAATGDAVMQVMDKVAQLRTDGHHVVGSMTVNVKTVTVDGNRATLTSCLDNGTVEVDGTLTPVGPPTPAYSLQGTAVRSGDSWRISELGGSQEPVC